MNSENLDEKSFALGLEAKQLPLEPEYLDRVAYNTGLQIYHGEEKVNELYRLNIGLVGFFRLVKENGRDISNSHGDIQGNVDIVTEKYQDFLRLVKSVPQFKNHTTKLEKRVTNTYQTLKEEVKAIFS
jgi:hypothetical protein